MEQTAQDNRRQAYRYRPPPVLEPIFSIIHQRERTRVDNVVDVNLRGARVTFLPSLAPRLNPGQEVTASIQAPGLDGCVDIGARVVFSGADNLRHVVALVFTDLPDVADRVDHNFFSVFNRRQDERTRTDNATSAVLLTNGEEPDEITGFQISVINYTGRGVAFVIDEKLDHLVRNRKTVELALQRPDDREPKQLVARIRHRATRGDTVYYGCIIGV